MTASAMPASSAPAGVSENPGNQPPGGPPGKGAVGGGESSGVRFDVLFRLARRYFGAHRTLTVLYVIGSLLSVSILPVATVAMYGRLSNYFQSGGGTASGVAGEAREGVTTPADAPAAVTGAPSPAQDVGSLFETYGFWVLLVVSGAIILFAHRYVSAAFSAKVENDLRTDAFGNLLRQSPAFFHRHDSGELAMVVNQLAAQAQMGLRQLLIDPVIAIVGLLVSGAVLLDALVRLASQQDARVYLLFGGIALFALAAPLLVLRRGRKLGGETRAVQQVNLAMASMVNGALRAPEEVQAMRAESFFATRYGRLLDSAYRSRLKQTVTMEQLNLMNSMPGHIVLIALIGLAILLVAADPDSAAPYTIVAVGLLTPQLMSMVQQLAGYTISANLTWPAIEAVEEALQREADVVDLPGARDIEDIEPTVEVRDVVFSYAPGQAPTVLNGVSFDLPTRKITGFVARPGRGKTTFFRLALRLYDPQEGEIRIGGHSTSEYTLASLRRNIALMSQHPAFFFGTVRENFSLARPDATDEEIRQVCDMTELWPILERAYGPTPLDTEFAAGAQLSGGQKRLFALSRLLLQRPAIILLDEPTVGMGPLEKYPLLETMKRACAGRTVVAVDHDIHWLSAFCDYFLVLEDGKIVQRGTKDELLQQKGGLFAELYATQRQDAEPPAGGAAAPGMPPPGMGGEARAAKRAG